MAAIRGAAVAVVAVVGGVAAAHVGLGLVPASDSYRLSPRVAVDPQATSDPLNVSLRSGRSTQRNTTAAWPCIGYAHDNQTEPTR